MNALFYIVAMSLLKISHATGLSYNEVNVLLYYFIIPLATLALIDKILKRHILKISFLALSLSTIFTVDFKEFCDTVFQESVDFLLIFNALGWNYTLASVIICVFIPVIVFFILLFLALGVHQKETVSGKMALKGSH